MGMEAVDIGGSRGVLECGRAEAAALAHAVGRRANRNGALVGADGIDLGRRGLESIRLRVRV
ncbi:hypothetical protein GCM10009819_33830 [Agromyces tropicus]|uniref:Uncharacterized protein n=1 Tax=Agromyces tropicus TaxID=555371 RepID=A0ABN2UWZ4_9MICO